MKILFFSRRFYPLIGGVEKHVLEISRRLIKKGHEITVITERYSNLSKEETIDGLKILRINSGEDGFFKKFRIWLELLKNINLIRSADIVHCHDVFFWYLPFRFIFPFKKVYTTFHGYEGNNIPNRRSILMHKLAEKISFGNICVGDFLKKWYGTKPTSVTYGGVDESLFEEASKKPTKDILFLGRLEEETGIMKYLEALKILKESGKNLSMDVFGEGSLSNKAEHYSKKNNLKVNFKGFVKNPEKYLSDYKYIFVSRYLGILEALAVKRSVFAEFNNEIKKDYLQITPFAKFIFIFSNQQDLFDKLREGTSKEALEAFNWISVQTWNKVTQLYLKLWKTS